MKKIIVITIFALFLFGCNSETNQQIDDETNPQTEIETNTYEDTYIYSQLMEYGIELFETETYKNYPTNDKTFFISLKDLSNIKNETFNYADKNNNTCDMEKTGIYFDPSYSIIQKQEDKIPMFIMIYGCTENDYQKTQTIMLQ